MSDQERKPRAGVTVSGLRAELPALAAVSKPDLQRAVCMALVDGGFDTVPFITKLPTWPRPESGGQRLARAFIDRVQERAPIHG